MRRPISSRQAATGRTSGMNIPPFLVPAAVALVFLVIIANFFFGGNSAGSNTQVGGTVAVDVTPVTDAAEVYIYLSGDSKKKLDGLSKFYPTDSKLEVRAGEAKITPESTDTALYVDKFGEVRFLGRDGTLNKFRLSNSSLWIESAASGATTQVELTNFTVEPRPGSVVVLNQNTRASNVSVVKGEAFVRTAQTSLSLGVGQKLTIVTNEAKNLTELSSLVEPIDDLLKTSELFLRHNGTVLLGSAADADAITTSGTTLSGLTTSGSTTLSGGTVSTAMGGSSTKILAFISPTDEMSVDGSIVLVEGNILSDKVVKITLNDRQVEIDRTLRTFRYGDFPLKDSVNNLVYKAYDAAGGVLAKGVMTVYSSSKTAATDTAQTKPTVTSYPISDKDFRITAPKDNPYKTTEKVVRIDGSVNRGVVDYITVNDYRLQKFTSGSTSWYYFANEDRDNLREGINLYTIKYYGMDGKLLNTSLFTIIRETPEPATTPANTVASGTTSASAAQ